MIGVFVFENTWRGWSAAQLARELSALRELGVNAVVTETIDPPTGLVSAAADLGLEAHVSVPCFSAHSWPHLTEGLDLQPILASGRPRQKMEWYTGQIPTDERYNRRIAELIEGVAAARPAGIVLDFVRWPLHWELELRAGAPEPEESSFDPTTLAAFVDWLRSRGADAAEVPAALDPATILTGLRDQWTAFKCDVITRFACAAAARVRELSPETTVGAFIVPGTPTERRQLLGQDTAELGTCLDVLLPMTYHGILHREVGFVGEVAREMQTTTRARVVPVVQATAEPEVAGGWDWGREVSVAEFGRAVEEALRAAAAVVVFPLEGLSEPRRVALSSVLDRR